MGSSDAEVVRAMVGAWNARDEEAAVSLTRPEIEFVNPPNALEPGTRRGRDEMRGVLRKQWEFLGDARQEIVALHERPDEILTEAHATRTMPGSDARIENRILMSWRVSDGLVRRIEVLGAGSDFERARRDAGLD